VQPVTEAETYSDAGKPLQGEPLVDLLRERWIDPNGFDQHPVTGKTLPERWTLELKSKAVDPKPARDPGVLFEIKAGKGLRKFTQLESGDIGIGSAPGDGGIEITATGIQPLHAIVAFDPSNPGLIEVTNQGEGTLTQVKDQTGERTAERRDRIQAALPATLTLGSAVVAVRRGRAMHLKYRGTRFFVRRRRLLRSFDPGTPYAERPLVVPSLDDPQHYGSSP
jgi:hypothetical protein